MIGLGEGLPTLQGGTKIIEIALVAQRTEHQPSKLLVVGSNPAEGADVGETGTVVS